MDDWTYAHVLSGVKSEMRCLSAREIMLLCILTLFMCVGVEKGFFACFGHGEMSQKSGIPAWKNSRVGTRIPTGNKNCYLV